MTMFRTRVVRSGSHAIQDRMRLVKGAVSGLLEASHGRHDEVVVSRLEELDQATLSG